MQETQIRSGELVMLRTTAGHAVTNARPSSSNLYRQLRLLRFVDDWSSTCHHVIRHRQKDKCPYASYAVQSWSRDIRLTDVIATTDCIRYIT